MRLEKLLSGGHHNSLGNTVEVVEMVLKETALFEELFNCYFSEDELVRLRVSSAMKRISKANINLLVPYIDRLLSEISLIQQASTQWTIALLFQALRSNMTEVQEQKACVIMQQNLQESNDWIVLNTTMEILSIWSKDDEALKAWLIPELDRLQADNRKSVSKRANKYYLQLTQ